MNKVILFIVLLLLVPGVFGLGVTPARTTVDFQPGLERSVSFTVVNSEKKDLNLVLFAQGELNESISLPVNTVSVSASEETKQLIYNVKLPQELRPGLRKGEVVILQLPDKTGNSDAFVGAAVGVATQLHVYVPYPGKYAEADMNVVNAEKGGDATFIISVVSRGDLGLSNVRANIDIYNKLGERVTTFNTNSIDLAPGEAREIVSKWKADVPVGTYRAVATVIYGGDEPITLEKQFNVGSSVLELQQVEVNDFSLGEIAKLDMLIENKWSEPIVGAYAHTQIFNEEGEVMADFKSPNYDIPPLTKTVMTSYWDTAGVKEGTYETVVNLVYGSDKSNRQDLKLKVSENEIEVIGLGYVISERSSGGGDDGNGLVTILIIAVVVLILINVSWFLFFRRKLKK